MRPRRSNALRFWLVVALCLGTRRGIGAQTGIPAGLEGGPEFLLPVGARGIGAAQAIVALGVGAEGIWWNPALVARGPREVAFNMAQQANGLIVADATGAIAWPVQHVGSFVLSVRYLEEGDLETTDINGTVIGSLYRTPIIVAGTFSAPFGSQFAAGLTLKFLQIGTHCTGRCDDVTTSRPRTAALDFGAQYFITKDSLVAIGASALNLGLPLQVNDSPQADPLPRRVDIGIGITPRLSQLPKEVHVHAEVDMLKALSGGGPGYLFGGELAWQDQYAARVGYQLNGPNGSGPTVGLGFATGKLHVDFAQVLTDAGAGSGKPTFLSLRYIF